MKSNTKEIERWSANWIAARSPFVFYRQFPKKSRNHINANCMTLTTVTPPASITVSIYAAALYSAMLFELNHHQNSYYSDYTHCWAVKMSNIFACNWNSIIYFSMVLMPLVCVNLLVIAFWVFPDFHPLRPKWLQSKTSNGIRTMRNEKPLTEFFFHSSPAWNLYFFLFLCCNVVRSNSLYVFFWLDFSGFYLILLVKYQMWQAWQKRLIRIQICVNAHGIRSIYLYIK